MRIKYEWSFPSHEVFVMVRLSKLLFLVNQSVEPINHLPPSTYVHTDSRAQSTGTSQSAAGWTKEQVKEWMVKNELTDRKEK